MGYWREKSFKNFLAKRNKHIRWFFTHCADKASAGSKNFQILQKLTETADHRCSELTCSVKHLPNKSFFINGADPVFQIKKHMNWAKPLLTNERYDF